MLMVRIFIIGKKMLKKQAVNIFRYELTLWAQQACGATLCCKPVRSWSAGVAGL